VLWVPRLLFAVGDWGQTLLVQLLRGAGFNICPDDGNESVLGKELGQIGWRSGLEVLQALVLCSELCA